ncbi:multidrug efflux SMR transporter [uncultured Pseudodesulfovibrio sp.]|uniref:DMT family transporter n=1 Tax=uncultured Pseudodesulfovibrio sp. TaxID=2035858 RepID=UPI0029C7C8B8|nr:multidrug efflux SMR transporter [uncultured Pseudodesulfovibrio sp.]
MPDISLLKNSWVLLYSAIVLEIGGTMAIKYSEGFSKLFPSACVIGLYCTSFYAMSLAVRKIELGVAYAIWSGVGIVLTSALGVILFHEDINLKKIVSITIIMIGVIALNLAAND